MKSKLVFFIVFFVCLFGHTIFLASAETGVILQVSDILVTSTGSWTQIVGPDETIGSILRDIRMYLLLISLDLTGIIFYFIISRFVGKK